MSVLESVISGNYKDKSQRSELSDYSIIDDDESPGGGLESLNEVMKQIVSNNVNLIKTRRDIYAEDILMTKIIHYVSEFSADVRSYLGKLRSKDALLSLQPKPA